LVDITNFLTFDVNRPLHVFDAAKIRGDLTVRFARPGEKLLALNGREYELDPEITAIADENGVQSLGGVIGGEPTGCTEATTEVFVEAALFDPIRTAATGRRLEIISDARYRFERGVDPAFVGPGLEIATRLILELCGGEASDIVVAGAEPDWHREYRLRPERLAGLGGLHVPPDESRQILEALGCSISEAAEHDGSLRVEPPSWRGDIVGEADLVEEVLRVKGYDEIPAVPLPRETVISRPAIDARRGRAELVRRTLVTRGLTEAVTFSFISSRVAELFGGDKPELRLVNPISAIYAAVSLWSSESRSGAPQTRGHPLPSFPGRRAEARGDGPLAAQQPPAVRGPDHRPRERILQSGVEQASACHADNRAGILRPRTSGADPAGVSARA